MSNALNALKMILGKALMGCGIHDWVGVRGDVVVSLFCCGTGELVSQEKQNLVVNAGKTTLAKLLGGDASYKNLEHVTKMAFGSDNTAASSADTALGGELFEKAVTVTYPAFNQVKFSATMESAEGGSNTYRELGLKTETTEKLFSRVVISDITKSTAYKIQVDWTISFQ